MVAQLIRQDDGSYDYVEVGTVPLPKIPPLSIPGEFEAYEGAKKGGDELISAPSITEQTERIQREIPSQVEFDEKTGTFITKKAKTIDLEYKKPTHPLPQEQRSWKVACILQSEAISPDPKCFAYTVLPKIQR